MEQQVLVVHFKRNSKGNETWVSPEVFKFMGQGKKQSNSESKNALMCNNRRYKHLTLCLHSKQLKNKTKSITLFIRMSHNVTIRYRCKLFAHKVARVDNLGSGSGQMS